MTLPIANISLANTFGHWVERTNELADAMSNFAITVGGNAAVGNAVVHGKFTANTIEVDTLTKFNGGNVTISTADLVVSNTASLTTIGTVSIKGSMNVDAVASIKIAGANTTHRVVSVINANGNLGFIKVEFPLDQLTDVDTSNIGVKDDETIIKWNANTGQWTANTLSLINSTRINTLNVGTISSTLVVTANANIGNNTVFVNNVSRRVGIGTNAPTAALSVNGSITATGDVSGFQTSDATFKDNISDLDTAKALDLIMQLHVKEFDWNEERVKNSTFASPDLSGHDVGLLAQQALMVEKNLVKRRPDGTLSLNYVGIVPYLVAAIQELKNEHRN